MNPSAIVIIILCVALAAALTRVVSLRQEVNSLAQDLMDSSHSAFMKREAMEEAVAERDVLARAFENAMKRTPAEAVDIVAKRHTFWENVGTDAERAPTAGETAIQEASEMNLPDPFEHHVIDPRDVRHPFQMIVKEDGVLRFKCNAIVAFLARQRLNDLAEMGFSMEDWEQLAQLIGYSLDGFCELSYVSDEARRAVEMARAKFEKEL